jgi:GTP cyclohydrolase I
MTEVVQEQPVLGLCFPAELFDEEALANTPGRILRMMEEFREWREWKDLETGRGIFPTESDDLVIVRDINFTSFCAHHILPFSGTASVAYLPTTHIVGLSKIPRTVRKFASRPQLQEYLTSQIADYLTTWIPGVRGVMVRIEAEHSCMQIRGARMTGVTETSAIRGVFRENDNLKNEVLQILRNK